MKNSVSFLVLVPILVYFASFLRLHFGTKELKSFVTDPEDVGSLRTSTREESQDRILPNISMKDFPNASALFAEMLKFSHDPTRKPFLRHKIRNSIGVYIDKAKSIAFNLNETIFISVFSYDASIGVSEVDHNWMCHLMNYGIKATFFIVSNDPTTDNDNEYFSRIEREYQNVYKHITVVQFPTELFWELVSKKTTPIIQGRYHANYKSLVPDFQRFGTMLKLFPILELIEQHNLNVIYFDPDIALIHDPIPFLMKGNAHVVGSQELRHCVEHSWPMYLNTRVEHLEMNSGVMKFRNTPDASYFLRYWIHVSVESNIYADQKAIRFYFGYETKSCRTGEEDLPPDTKGLTFCVLNELLFANGYIAFKCTRSHRYSVSIARVGVNTTVTKVTSKRKKTVIQSATPVTLHFNYLNTKVAKMKEVGFWLVNTSSHCRPLDIENTYFFREPLISIYHKAISEYELAIQVCVITLIILLIRYYPFTYSFHTSSIVYCMCVCHRHKNDITHKQNDNNYASRQMFPYAIDVCMHCSRRHTHRWDVDVCIHSYYYAFAVRIYDF